MKVTPVKTAATRFTTPWGATAMASAPTVGRKTRIVNNHDTAVYLLLSEIDHREEHGGDDQRATKDGRAIILQTTAFRPPQSPPDGKDAAAGAIEDAVDDTLIDD